MITYDEMPDDNAELAKIEIDFPYLKDNTPASCPSLMNRSFTQFNEQTCC